MLECETLSTKQVSDVLGIPVSLVEQQKARLDKRDKLRSKFLATGLLQPYEEQVYSHFTIFQR